MYLDCGIRFPRAGVELLAHLSMSRHTALISCVSLERPASCSPYTASHNVAGCFHILIFFSFPQPTNFQRALFQQVVGACKPCSDPNLSMAEKGTFLTLGTLLCLSHLECLTLVLELSTVQS